MEFQEGHEGMVVTVSGRRKLVNKVREQTFHLCGGTFDHEDLPGIIGALKALQGSLEQGKKTGKGGGNPRALRTMILDFDGVIHSYPAWKGIIPTDPPTEGAREAIAKLRETFLVKVLSTRCTEEAGVRGIEAWLLAHDIPVDGVIREKEKAVLMVDDRGYRFMGNWDELLAFAFEGNMEPWNRKRAE